MEAVRDDKNDNKNRRGKDSEQDQLNQNSESHQVVRLKMKKKKKDRKIDDGDRVGSNMEKNSDRSEGPERKMKIPSGPIENSLSSTGSQPNQHQPTTTTTSSSSSNINFSSMDRNNQFNHQESLSRKPLSNGSANGKDNFRNGSSASPTNTFPTQPPLQYQGCSSAYGVPPEISPLEQNFTSDQNKPEQSSQPRKLIIRLKMGKAQARDSHDGSCSETCRKRTQETYSESYAKDFSQDNLDQSSTKPDPAPKKSKQSTRGRGRGSRRARPTGSFNSSNRAKGPMVTLPTYAEYCPGGNLPEDVEIKTQSRTCIAFPHHLRLYRCAPCIAKVVGLVCAFRFFRQWVCRKDSEEMIAGPIFPLSVNSPDQLSYRRASFPKKFSRNPTPKDLLALRKLLSRALLPAIEQEIEWLQDKTVCFVGRRVDMVTKCDYCSATLIGAAWLCKHCGAEACLRCFQVMSQQASRVGQHPNDSSEQRKKFEMHDGWLQRLLMCTKWRDGAHSPSTHLKIAHMTLEELEDLKGQMTSSLQSEDCASIPFLTNPAISSPDAHLVPPDLSHFLYQPPGEDSEAYIKIDFHELESNPEIFHRLWAAGQAIVVTGMKERLKLPWEPKYFIEKYGLEMCNMLDSNETWRPPVEISVEDFFKKFENETEEGKPVWKLRDWPPEADFQEKFGELFDDFQGAIPIPDVTTRTGIFNIAAHFPTNANVPDLGPKMYIAMNNSVDVDLSDKVDFNGSTVLHMDVADAINVQTYAGKNNDGYALWHLYHAKHTEDLRKFLYNYRAEKLKISLEDSMTKFDDPIHTMRIYIDAGMRKRLRDEYGIRGWEIKQKPGEAVFIPAYTAHQVCNKANCIKVAADFVSPESINRCILLTEEFRVQNHEHKKPWRDDILQINQMLLYAFHSTTQLLESFEA